LEGLGETQLIPTHTGHLVFVLLGLEALDVSIKDTNAVDVAFLRMLAEQLLTDTNAENGLLQVTYYLVKPASLQIFHSFSSMSLTRKHDAVSLL
jgi:hypothetical protein